MSEGPLSTSAEHPIFAVKFTEPIEVGSDGRECKIYAKDETPTKYTKSFSDRKNYVVLDDGDLVYRAGESSSFNGTSSYSLVSYDPETNEWEFKQMCYARIGTRIRSSSTLDELGEKMPKEASYTDANVFRSGKFMRNIERRNLATINDSDIIDPGASMQNMTEKIKKSTVIKAKTRGKVQTPILLSRNANAKTVSEIYALEDIIPSEKLTLVDVDELLANADVDSKLPPNMDKICPWVYHKIVSHSAHGADKNVLRKTIYLSYMIKLYCVYNNLQKVSNLRKALGEPSHEIYLFLLSSFTSRENSSEFGGWKPSMALKNKLLTHIVCLALMVSGYQLDPQDLSIDLKVPVKVVVKMAKALGCKFEATSGERKRKRIKILALSL